MAQREGRCRGSPGWRNGSISYSPMAEGYLSIGECYVGDFMRGGELEGRRDLPLETF
jgi:hypothetical protein